MGGRKERKKEGKGRRQVCVKIKRDRLSILWDFFKIYTEKHTHPGLFELMHIIDNNSQIIKGFLDIGTGRGERDKTTKKENL